MTALKVLFIGGSGQISSALLAARGRPRPRPLRAQPRADVDPPAARRRAPAAGRHPRPGLGPGRDRRARVRRRRRLGRLHARARAGRHRPLHRAHGPVRLHQLGVGLPEAGRAPADRRVHAAAQPGLALLAGEDRVRGAAGARVPRGRLPGDDRAALAHLRPREPALRGRLDGRRAHAPGQGGRGPRRRHLAVDAHPPRRLRQGASSGCSAIRRRSATASTSPPTRC